MFNAQQNENELCIGQENGTLLPNPNNSSSYYYCLNEEATLQNCTENSLFDLEKQECMLQYDTTVDENFETNSTEDNEIPTTLMPENNSTESITTEMSIEPTPPVYNNLSETYYCPCYDTVLPTYLEDEDSCENYYMCYRGKPLKMSCCKGHHWSTELGYCIPEYLSNCQVHLYK